MTQWLAPLKGDAILAEAPRNRYADELKHIKEAKAVWAKNRMPKIIVNREGTDLESTFVAAWEPFNAESFLTEVTSLKNLEGTGLGWTLADATEKKTVLYRPLEAEGSLSSGDFEVNGRFAIRSTKGEVTSLDLTGGTFVSDGKMSAKLAETTPLEITGLTHADGKWTIAVSGDVAGFADQGGDQFVVYAQEGVSNRWLRLDRVEPAGEEAQIVLAEDHGFTSMP